MRMRTTAIIGVSLLALVSSGCGWFGDSQPTGGVAVVDLDELAKQVGANDEISQALKTRETSLNMQLNSMKTNYVAQLQERKTLYGENPTDEQNQQLVSISRQVQLNLATAQRKAASHLSSHRGELIMKFREQVSPIAQEIARQRGLSLVVPKNEGWLIAVDDSIDITDEVAVSLKETWQPIVTVQPVAAAQPHVVAQPHNQGVQPAGHQEPVQQP